MVGKKGKARLTHVRLDQMASRQRAHQTQLSRHDARSDYPRQPSSVVTRRLWVRARDAEHLETGVLGREERSAADGADFDGGHGDGDEEVLSVVGAGREAR
jgi:hypothetical protein